jgi:hypothetical protein
VKEESVKEESMMGRVVAMVVTLVAIAVPCQAKDWCFNIGGSGVVVARGFTNPKKNKCKSVTGFIPGNGDTVGTRAVTGAVCANVTGTLLRATFIFGSAGDGTMGIVSEVFSLPLLQDGHVETKGLDDFGDGFAGTADAQLAQPCPSKMDIP